MLKGDETSVTPKTVYLKDYSEPNYWIDRIDLHVDLYEDRAEVQSTLQVRRNNTVANESTPLFLDGEELEFLSASIAGNPLKEGGSLKVTESGLEVKSVPESFELVIKNKIRPQDNTAFEGLYKSKSIFCTQCEAEGFRRITYYVDRPDVMARYTTTITAEKAMYPTLLSNGNLIEAKDLDGGRHLAKWEDPFKKPCYLFALVAGDLDRVDDTFTTQSGREVKLQIFTDKGRSDRCGHAMESLKNSMRWDETTYGLEYDLDIFMIVAVDDFNAGAMENKGLNIFNAKYVLADPKTATDSDYEGIEGVVGHEYFHNWTGNRVTCRDWFQLSLKEGLTVYRDQEFSADMTSRTVKRIEDVDRLRTYQFPEDAGPTSHPIRPASCISVDNFYTLTVYEKGSEVIRMIETIVGKSGFRAGIDKYFELYDEQAVTTEDFIHAMEVANGVDLTQFKNWYDQAGTPTLKIEDHYDATKKEYQLTVKQETAPTSAQSEKKPFHIPLRVGLMNAKGVDLEEQVLSVKENQQSFTFKGIDEKPTPSLLRGFSAPVNVEYEYTDDELMFLIANDNDLFNRWEAGQKLFSKNLMSLVDQVKRAQTLVVPQGFVALFGEMLKKPLEDLSMLSQMLYVPTEKLMLQWMPEVDVEAIHKARKFLVKAIAEANSEELLNSYKQNVDTGPYQKDQKAIGRRAIKNRCLSFLGELGDEQYQDLALEQLKSCNNMTDEEAALAALRNHQSKQAEEGFQLFYKKWNDDSLVILKWMIQSAVASRPDVLERVKKITTDKAFDIYNPNNVYSLLGSFALHNHYHFHDLSGKGYEYITDRIIDIDHRNPQVAARLASAFQMWKRYDGKRQSLMKVQLERIVQDKKISKNTYEIVSKSLKG